MKRPRRKLVVLQRRIAEGAWEIPIALILGLIGLAGALSGNGITPATLDATLPIWLVQAWTLGIGSGGILTAIGKLTERERVEAAGLALLGYGATLYAVVLSIVGWPQAATAASAMAAIAISCFIRLYVVSLSLKSRTVATGMSGEAGPNE